MIYLSHPIVCIVGPTASGKTDLAQAYAEYVSGEIVSADSMQIYTGMDIGTGKIAASKRTVPYHCLDIADPGAPYSAALFQRAARDAFAEIDARGRQAVLVGGTGFYIRAAIDDYRFPQGEQKDNPIRERYESICNEHGAEALWEILNDADPESARCIHKNNVKRVIRALEMLENGESYSGLSKSLKVIPQLYDALFIGLDVDREVLNDRICNRVDEMVEQGLVDEVRNLLDEGFRDGLTASQAIGYKEIVEHIDGNVTLDFAIDSIKKATKRYAKRQRTWFNKDKRINWIDVTDASLEDMLDSTLRIACEYLEEREVQEKWN